MPHKVKAAGGAGTAVRPPPASGKTGPQRIRAVDGERAEGLRSEPKSAPTDFSRSRRAALILARALREDSAAAARRAAERVSIEAKRSRARLAAARSARRDNPGPGPSARLGAIGGALQGAWRRWRRGDAAAGGRRPARRFHLAGTAAALLVALLVGAGGMFYWALRDVPWAEIADGSLKPVIVLEGADGQLLVQQGPFQGAYAAREDFPPHLVDAVLSVEDRRFYEHAGVDLRGIARAVLRNLSAGGVVEGGSTITQQLIKILYLESDRTWKRKIQEFVIAFWLEARLGKEEILTRYLNNVYLGSGATGMPAAARIYFNKDVGELDLRESAVLAGLLRSPSQLNPLDNPEAARRRASVVIRVMVENGKLTPAEADAANAEFAALHPTRPVARTGSWFSDWVFEQAREIAGPFRGTITVRTTIVPRLQAIAEEAVREALEEQGAAGNASQAALVAMTPDGAVVAMVGGRDYGESEFNRAVSAMRQPGSTFKLFVYYAALKAGFDPRDRIRDEPVEIDGWSPENFGGRFHGRVSIAEAFARSLNAATVSLAQEVGTDKVIAAARELGIEAKLSATPALALGASEVSLLDLTGAYASVRAGVAPVEPWGIVGFQADGQPRAFRIGPATRPTVSLEEHQEDLVGLLRLVVTRGTGEAAALDDGFAAGKTGTSQESRDAWFVGFTEPLVAGVWVGNDDDSPMSEVTGGGLPATIFRKFMEAALAEQPAPEPEEEEEIELVGASAEPEPVSCNVRACSRHYRSFRASDCTFQPYRGPRRLCER